MNAATLTTFAGMVAEMSRDDLGPALAAAFAATHPSNRRAFADALEEALRRSTGAAYEAGADRVLFAYGSHIRGLGSTIPVEHLRAARLAINGEIAARAGSGIIVTDCGDLVHDMPAGGATMTVSWCTSNGPTVTWYATRDAAHAALLRFAESEGRAVLPDRWFVDLTPEGCRESSAWCEDRAGLPAAPSSEVAA